MKPGLTYILLLLLAFAHPVMADNLGYTKENPLIFGVDMDYAPLEYVDETGIPKGFDVDFTQELMKRLRIPFTYAPNTWENISDDVLSGKVDLGMMVYSPYRKDIINYSRAVFRLYYQIVYREESKGNIRRFDVRNLSNKSIAYMSSHPVTDTLTKAGAVLNVVKDLSKAMNDLSRGKYDAVICFRYQAKYLISKFHLNNLKTEDLTLTPREYCYVSHDKKLIDAISDELDRMDAGGDITEIYGMDVTSQFGKIEIPMWVWGLLAVLILFMLLSIIVIQRRSKALLLREMERARQSEQLKGIFLSNVSHALRTPLNAIIGFSDLMMSTPDEEMKREERDNLLGIINQNGIQLLHFINELLSLSDIEGNKLLFDRVVVNIDLEISNYATEIRQQLEEGVSLEVNEPAGGIRALLDPNLMRMVTMHLLQNAQSHTHEGVVTMSYKVKDGGLYVEVKDTGTGLPEKLKDNIFALLSDKNTFIQEETPGLGLSICKAIIDRCGGKIGARENTEQGHGTVFWYWVPVKIL